METQQRESQIANEFFFLGGGYQKKFYKLQTAEGMSE